ncbi:hypothetical protein JCM4914_50650 [Streptomyces platensis subsp. malvinus]
MADAVGEAEAEFRGEHDLVAAAAQRPADQLLVVAVGAVAVRGVDEGGALVDGGEQGGGAALLVGLAVDAG